MANKRLNALRVGKSSRETIANMSKLAFGICFYLVGFTVVWGGQLDGPRFTMTAKLTQDAIRPGEPLYMSLSVTREPDKLNVPASVSITSNYNLVYTRVENDEGIEMPERPNEPWPKGAMGFTSFKSLKSGESFSKTLVVHQWSSTDLEPGDYTVTLVISRATFRLESSGAERQSISENPVEIVLPLRVLAPDNAHVSRRFDHLVAMTCDDALPLSDRMLAFDSLIFAQGPLALPSQLDLVEAIASDRVHVAFDQRDLSVLFWYIVHSGNVETAQALVDFVERPPIQALLNGATT